MKPAKALEEDEKREGLATVDVATVVAAEDVVVASFSEVGVASGVAASFADVAVTAVVVVVAVAELVAVDEE